MTRRTHVAKHAFDLCTLFRREQCTVFDAFETCARCRHVAFARRLFRALPGLHHLSTTGRCLADLPQERLQLPLLNGIEVLHVLPSLLEGLLRLEVPVAAAVVLLLAYSNEILYQMTHRGIITVLCCLCWGPRPEDRCREYDRSQNCRYEPHPHRLRVQSWPVQNLTSCL